MLIFLFTVTMLAPAYKCVVQYVFSILIQQKILFEHTLNHDKKTLYPFTKQ